LAANECKKADSYEFLDRSYPGGIELLERNWTHWVHHGAHYAQML